LACTFYALVRGVAFADLQLLLPESCPALRHLRKTKMIVTEGTMMIARMTAEMIIARGMTTIAMFQAALLAVS